MSEASLNEVVDYEDDFTEASLNGPIENNLDDLGEPEDFDFGAWVEGVRPSRRSVRLTARADLLARLDDITAEINALSDDDREGAAELQAEFQEVRDQIVASQRQFVVEARTERRLTEVVKSLGLVRPSQKKKEELREYNITTNLHQLLDAIVIPSKITYEDLRRLHEVAPSQVERLLGALAQANAAAPEVPPNFSRRR